MVLGLRSTTLPVDIICFAKDWGEPKTCNNHIVAELAKRHRVLWVNPVATRNPNITSANDLKKIGRRVRGWFKGVEIVHDRLRILNAVSLPFPHSRFAERLNQFLVTYAVKRAAQRWGLHKPQLWIFPPNAVSFIGYFDESLIVYYCVDEWSEFSHIRSDYMRAKEASLLQKADVVFAVSDEIVASKSKFNANTYLAPPGVDHPLFAQALRDDFPVAEQLRGLPRPVIGFYGSLYDWVDQELLAAMAKRRPLWSFVLVGKIMCDVSTLHRHANIHLLGPQPFEELPNFCKGFDVALIPYRVNDPRTKGLNPLKLREYISAGLPVVSVDIPQLRALPDLVSIAHDANTFIERIESAMLRDSPAKRYERSERMKSETWSSRVAACEAILSGVDTREGVASR